MAAASKHYGDVNMWIEKIIDSCDSTIQQSTIRNLIQQFEKMLDEENTTDFNFRYNIIWKLKRKLENKLWELFDEKIKEQEKEENYKYAIL